MFRYLEQNDFIGLYRALKPNGRASIPLRQGEGYTCASVAKSRKKIKCFTTLLNKVNKN